jgi:hypothetical protein
MAQSTEGKAFNMEDLVQQIKEGMQKVPPFPGTNSGNSSAPRVNAPSLSMPDHVEQTDGTAKLGQLSAEAIVREYEAAAKEIEAMGAEVLEGVNETAARYREEAKRIFLEIQNCSVVTTEVRRLCVEMKDKIAGTRQGRKQNEGS